MQLLLPPPRKLFHRGRQFLCLLEVYYYVCMQLRSRYFVLLHGGTLYSSTSKSMEAIFVRVVCKKLPLSPATVSKYSASCSIALFDTFIRFLLALCGQGQCHPQTEQFLHHPTQAIIQDVPQSGAQSRTLWYSTV